MSGHGAGRVVGGARGPRGRTAPGGALRRLAAALALLPSLALTAALATPAAPAADLPAGDAALVYQIRTSHTDDPAASPSTPTEQDLGLLLSQEIPNYGFLRLEAHGLDPIDGGAGRGWTQAALTDLDVRGARAALALGDVGVDAGLLPRRLLILVDPTFDVEGAHLALVRGAYGFALFSGRAVDRTGSFASAVTRFDQDVAGASLRARLGDRAAVRALYVHVDGAGLLGRRVPASNDAAGLGADLRLAGPLALLGEVRYTSDPNAAGGAARTDGVSYAVGPLLSRPGLRAEATLFSLDPAYLPVEGTNLSADRRGLYGGVSWDPARAFGLFGSTHRNRNNLAGDPALATIETTQVILGGRAYLPARWPVTVVVRGDRTRLDTLSTPASTEADSVTTSLLGEVAQVIGAWRPLLRARWSRFDDQGIDESSRTLDLTGELWWQVTRRSRLWVVGQWTDLSASAGLSGATRYLGRAGGEQRVSSALFLRGEAEVSRVDETGFETTRAGLAASIGYRHRLFDLYLDVRRNWTDTTAATGDRTDDVAYVRASVPLRWGRPTPPPVGRPDGERGWGGIEGSVFVDADADGVRDPGEAGLDGLRLVLDGLPGVTTRTGAGGRYAFPRVVLGPHFVRLEVRRLPADYDLVSPQLVTVEVERRRTATADFAVQPLGRIEGRVVRVVQRPDGSGEPAPADSLPVFLRRGDDTWQSFTDADGRFAFENVRAGDYEVFVDPAGLPRDAGVEPPARTLRLGVGEATTGVDFVVRQPARPEIRDGLVERDAVARSGP